MQAVACNLCANVSLISTPDDAVRKLLCHRPCPAHVLLAGEIGTNFDDTLCAIVEEVTGTRLIRLGEATAAETCARLYASTKGALETLLQDAAAARATPADISGADLKAALSAGHVRLRYQPIVDAHTGAPLGAEALVRLHHPVHGTIWPDNFLPQIDAWGLERRLAAFVLDNAIQTLAHLRRDRGWISINLPRHLVCAETSVRRLLARCGEAGIAPEQLHIEMLETPDRPDTRSLGRMVQNWRRAGFHLTIDDAGPRLPYWRDLLPLGFDAIKLDRAVTATPATQDAAATIALAAQSHGLAVIAEGIETEMAAARLAVLPIDAWQGFLLAPPLHRAAFDRWIAHREGMGLCPLTLLGPEATDPHS